ncbi:exopolysaccharide biosynthesis polyprenyl glycosylphosphotransferase [Acetonema longum DSM 6540]|uniref:Exopolysaccharide biosynthesis polyprenyl glycosylphosphotransferase n=2 Tax=Acetonema TaxID=2373 RepID=F7NLY0_9FIRM|nr:exopolysaccharide biosynthesis polyprenyl glycosylphosphotransferase [Acetonema longum DSM 6540]
MILCGTDYLTLVAAMWSAFYMRELIILSLFPRLLSYPLPNYFYYVTPLIFMGFLFYERIYARRLPFWKNIELVFKVCSYSVALIIGVFFVTGIMKDMSRILIALIWVTSFAYLVVTQYALKRLLLYCGLWQKPVVIVGAGKTAELLVKAFEADPGMGYKVAGVIEDHYQERPLAHQYPLWGNFSNIEEAVMRSGVRDVMVAAPGLEREQLLDLVYRIQPHVSNLILVPNLFGIPMANLEAETMANQQALLLRIKNNLARTYNRLFKYTFDIIATILGGLAVLPVMGVTAILIYIDSPGPVFFAHRRVGAKGERFLCYKFRTMVVDAGEKLEQYLEQNPDAAAEWRKDFKLKDDPRITRMGKWLRQTSLDELPQIINVLKGEMSLVGPRPIVEKEIEKYGETIHDYYLVRPGITGYWQVNGRNDVDYETRVQMDSWYVRNWSLWLDMVILMKTFNVVFRKEGAY